MSREISIEPPNPRTIVDQLDFTMQWHLEKALGMAQDIPNQPIYNNLILLQSHLRELRRRIQEAGVQ
jgi:hypothetical protein